MSRSVVQTDVFGKESMRFIAFDLETTGTLPGVNKIIEIGAVRFERTTPVAVFSSLVNPREKIPQAAFEVNHISDEMVAKKPFIENLLNPFAKFCADDILVAHNANFDAQFLIHDIKKHRSFAPKGIVLDTLSMSRKAFKGLSNYKLSTIVKHLNLNMSQSFHRAEEDAFYCAQVFMKILQKFFPTSHPSKEDLLSLTNRSTPLKFPQLKAEAIQLSFF